MAFFATKLRREKPIHQLFCQRAADDASSENQNVYLIMLDALARGIAVVTQAGANAGDFIGGNRSADTAAANEHAPLGFAVENDFRQCLGIIWIIDRCVTGCADVDDGVPCRSQVLADKLL